MRFGIDSADLAEITRAKEIVELGKVTTNPSLVRAALGKDVTAARIVEHHLEILKLVGKKVPVSFEVVSNTYNGMVAEGVKLHDLFSPYGNVVVKIPSNPSMDYDSLDSNDLDGLLATAYLRKRGIKANITLVFKPEQAILFALLRANYVSPFIGRQDHYLWKLEDSEKKHAREEQFPVTGILRVSDNGIVSGVSLVYSIVEYFKLIGSTTEVLGASLRNTKSIAETKAVGAQLATVPLGVLEEWVGYEEKDIEKLIIPQPERERQLDEFVDAINRLRPKEAGFVDRLIGYFKENHHLVVRYLRHPQTLDGMKKFTEDTVPAYSEMLGATASVE
ncbi:MAG: hypothetical protein IIA87_05460 [Nanoarchaeota archaeon]|nr:hypothetical protein [Nanoarchaeota archaeon]